LNKLQKDLKKIAKPRTFLIIFILLVAAVVWFKYAVGLVLLAIFVPFTFMTVRYSKMVPHISIESFTSTTYFIGYVFGPIYALIYGPIVGMGCYVANSFVNPNYLSTPVFAGLTGALAGLVKVWFGATFVQAFIIALVVRTIIAFPWFMLFVDPLEVFTHQISQFFSNLVIYLPILSALYAIVGPLV